jgi:hypothetical protein
MLDKHTFGLEMEEITFYRVKFMKGEFDSILSARHLPSHERAMMLLPLYILLEEYNERILGAIDVLIKYHHFSSIAQEEINKIPHSASYVHFPF